MVLPYQGTAGGLLLELLREAPHPERWWLASACAGREGAHLVVLGRATEILARSLVGAGALARVWPQASQGPQRERHTKVPREASAECLESFPEFLLLLSHVEGIGRMVDLERQSIQITSLCLYYLGLSLVQRPLTCKKGGLWTGRQDPATMEDRILFYLWLGPKLPSGLAMYLD